LCLFFKAGTDFRLMYLLKAVDLSTLRMVV
jgi:hypothetical protein